LRLVIRLPWLMRLPQVRRYSLIRVVADGLYVHRLLQTVVRAALDGDAERTWAAAAVRLLRASFPTTSKEVANWPEGQRLLPHVLAVANHGQRLDVKPEEWLWLLHHAAIYLWSRGQYHQALRLYEQTVTGFRRVLGEDHVDTLALMNNLATTRRALGDLKAARQLHEQTLAASRRVLGEDHPDTLTSVSNFAAVRRELGELSP
jgi:tetratricopeptide (TPR) repeat protein